MRLNESASLYLKNIIKKTAADMLNQEENR